MAIILQTFVDKEKKYVFTVYFQRLIRTNVAQKWPVGASLQVVVNWHLIEYHDVSPGKASFPSWLQVFIDALPVCLQHLFDGTRKSSAMCIWRSHLGPVWAGFVVVVGAGGKLKDKRSSRERKNGLAIQSRPLEECLGELPNPGNVSDTNQTGEWRRTC